MDGRQFAGDGGNPDALAIGEGWSPVHAECCQVRFVSCLGPKIHRVRPNLITLRLAPRLPRP